MLDNAEGVNDAKMAILKNRVNLYKAQNNFDVINEEARSRSIGSSEIPSIHDSNSERDQHSVDLDK